MADEHRMASLFLPSTFIRRYLNDISSVSQDGLIFGDWNVVRDRRVSGRFNQEINKRHGREKKEFGVRPSVCPSICPCVCCVHRPAAVQLGREKLGNVSTFNGLEDLERDLARRVDGSSLLVKEESRRSAARNCLAKRLRQLSSLQVDVVAITVVGSLNEPCTPPPVCCSWTPDCCGCLVERNKENFSRTITATLGWSDGAHVRPTVINSICSSV